MKLKEFTINCNSKWQMENVRSIISSIIDNGLAVLKSKNLKIDAGVLAMSIFECSHHWAYSADNTSRIVILGIEIPTEINWKLERDTFNLVDNTTGNLVQFTITI